MRRPETWGRSTIRTACPLDCPDSCTVDVTVEQGRVVGIDGGDENPVTRNFICGKVRRFPERLYGEDRLLYPAMREGAKGGGSFTRVTWGEALDHIAARMVEIRDRRGAEAILPFCYGGSNGLLTQDTKGAALFRASARHASRERSVAATASLLRARRSRTPAGVTARRVAFVWRRNF